MLRVLTSKIFTPRIPLLSFSFVSKFVKKGPEHRTWRIVKGDLVFYI